jgi:hypothetical protein
MPGGMGGGCHQLQYCSVPCRRRHDGMRSRSILMRPAGIDWRWAGDCGSPQRAGWLVPCLGASISGAAALVSRHTLKHLMSEMSKPMCETPLEICL